MQWTSAISLKTQLEDALRECSDALRDQKNVSPDLAILFVSPHFMREYATASKLLHRFFRPRHLFGCSAGGVIAAGKEAEGRPAVGIIAGYLPGVHVTPFHLEPQDLPDMDASPRAWARVLRIEDRTARPHFLLIADPFTFNPEDLTQGLDYAFPESVKIGGLASGATHPGQNILYLDSTHYASGIIGLALTGNIMIDPIVAQGCRPIGKQFQITSCEENRMLELNRRPAIEALEETLEALPIEDRPLVQHSLLLGICASPLKQSVSRGDYLIRNIIGLDQQDGWLAVGSMLRNGQNVRFHLRDKRTSTEDLSAVLQRYAASRPSPPPAGALLFSCMGRGEHLYGVANHDTNAFMKSIGPLPIGGFFCNGEIGPVKGTTYLHGYTSCFGIFRPLNTENNA